MDDAESGGTVRLRCSYSYSYSTGTRRELLGPTVRAFRTATSTSTRTCGETRERLSSSAVRVPCCDDSYPYVALRAGYRSPSDTSSRKNGRHNYGKSTSTKPTNPSWLRMRMADYEDCRSEYGYFIATSYYNEY
eukprot:scaffold47490_cov25-Prasinocladus_malaysianus.AAC.1